LPTIFGSAATAPPPRLMRTTASVTRAQRLSRRERSESQWAWLAAL